MFFNKKDIATTKNNDLEKQLKALIEVNNALVGVLNLDETLSLITNTLVKTINISFSGVYVWEEKLKKLKLKSINLPTIVQKMGEIQLGNLFANVGFSINDTENYHIKSFSRNEFLTTQDYYDLSRPLLTKQFSATVQKLLRAKWGITVPLVAKDKKLGVLSLVWKGKEINENDKIIIKTFADQIATALYNSQLFEEKQKSVEDLEETLRKERDMIDIIGHELRTPLTSAKTGLEVVKMNIAKEELENKTLDKYMKNVEESLNREVALLETMLSTTKLDKGELGLSYQKVNLKEIVGTSYANFDKKAKDKGLELILTPPTRAVHAYCDALRAQEVVDNLIDNSIKYTNKGSITVEIESIDKNVTIKVSDTGVGIAKEDLKNIGNKFFRAKTYLGDGDKNGNNLVRPGGTGLGLYVSFNLIESMDGKISIKSVEGEGSTFKVTLPAYIGQKEALFDKSSDLDKFAKFRKDKKKVKAKKKVKD